MQLTWSLPKGNCNDVAPHGNGLCHLSCAQMHTNVITKPIDLQRYEKILRSAQYMSVYMAAHCCQGNTQSSALTSVGENYNTKYK